MNNINKIIQQRESELRIKFLEWSSEYLADVQMRKHEDKERKDLTTSCINDLFEMFFNKIKQFQKETNKMIIDEVVRMVEEKRKEYTDGVEGGNGTIRFFSGLNIIDDIIKELKQ